MKPQHRQCTQVELETITGRENPFYQISVLMAYPFIDTRRIVCKTDGWGNLKYIEVDCDYLIQLTGTDDWLDPAVGSYVGIAG